MLKKRLFTPGPTSVPEEVLLAMAQPVIHHRTPEFKKIAEGVFSDLKYVFQTAGDVVIMASSGTGAMEAAVVNLCSPGETIVAVSAGKFGERWQELGKAYGLNVIVLEVEWGKPLDPKLVAATLEAHPKTRAVFMTLCETSTATHYDVEAVGKIVAGMPETALVVDAISSLGAVPCMTDAWHVDVVVTGSQKALMLPPGLAFMSVSAKAWSLVEKSTSPRYYFDLRQYRKSLPKSDFPFTMAVSLVIGLSVSLRRIREMTVERVWAEHAKRAEATRAAFAAMGLRLFSAAPSDALTAVVLPEGLDGEKLLKTLRDTHGMSVAEGQAHLKGKIVRVSHLGWQDEFDVLTAIAAVGTVMEKMGAAVPVEKGIGAARKVLFG